MDFINFDLTFFDGFFILLNNKKKYKFHLSYQSYYKKLIEYCNYFVIKMKQIRNYYKNIYLNFYFI